MPRVMVNITTRAAGRITRSFGSTSSPVDPGIS